MSGTPGSTAPSAAHRGPRPTLRTLAWRWGPAIVWAGVIFTLSAQPGLRVSDDASVDAPVRHIAHITAFAVMTVLLVHAVAGLGRPLTWRTTLIVAAIAIGYGITDEVHQAFVPSRTARAIDVGYDTLGTLLGLGVAWSWSWVARRRQAAERD